MKRIGKYLNLCLDFVHILIYSILVSTIITVVKDEASSFYEYVVDEVTCPYENNKLVLSDKELNNIKKRLKPVLAEKIPTASLADENIENYFLLNAVYENTNMDEELKDNFYDLIKIIEDCPDLNKEESYKTLKRLRYIFGDDSLKDSSSSRAILGQFCLTDSYIELFYNDLENDLAQSTMNHENIHALFSLNINNMPTFFIEGVTTLLEREYFADDPYSIFTGNIDIDDSFIYIPEMTTVKLLCELVGSDKVLEAYSKEDITIIYEELEKITGTLDDAKTLICNLDKIISKFNYSDALEFTSEDEDVFNKLKNYRDIKLNDNDNTFGFDYNILILNNLYRNDFMEKYIDLADILGIYEKAYFCEELKNVSRNDLVEYEDRLIYPNGRSDCNSKGFQKTK